MRLQRLPLLPLFICLSLVIGLLIPSIYEFSQELHNRSLHAGLEQLAIFVALLTVAVYLFFAWRREKLGQPASIVVTPIQFRLRELFIAITFTAVLLALVPLLTRGVASAFVVVLVVATLAWAFRGNVRRRSQTIAILATMFLPFAWIFAVNKPFGHVSGLLPIIPLCPGIFFAELLRNLLHFSREASAQLAIVFVVVQLLIGIGTVRRGGKLPVVYAVVMLVASSFSSLVIHAMYRM
jgi:hypothetical protein